jgi:hypothetical protein
MTGLCSVSPMGFYWEQSVSLAFQDDDRRKWFHGTSNFLVEHGTHLFNRKQPKKTFV